LRNLLVILLRRRRRAGSCLLNLRRRLLLYNRGGLCNLGGRFRNPRLKESLLFVLLG
jgi:hypothetical protein